MNTFEFIACALLAGFLLYIILCSFMLYRNEWVYRNIIKCIENDTYELLPEYDYMMQKWWIWDIEKFKDMK